MLDFKPIWGQPLSSTSKANFLSNQDRESSRNRLKSRGHWVCSSYHHHDNANRGANVGQIKLDVKCLLINAHSPIYLPNGNIHILRNHIFEIFNPPPSSIIKMCLFSYIKI